MLAGIGGSVLGAADVGAAVDADGLGVGALLQTPHVSGQLFCTLGSAQSAANRPHVVGSGFPLQETAAVGEVAATGAGELGAIVVALTGAAVVASTHPPQVAGQVAATTASPQLSENWAEHTGSSGWLHTAV